MFASVLKRLRAILKGKFYLQLSGKGDFSALSAPPVYVPAGMRVTSNSAFGYVGFQGKC